MIKDKIPKFLRRLSDEVYEGRNRVRILLGTDRKEKKDSGYGDGGENDKESGTIDLVVNFVGEDPDYRADGARIYISGKTDPDDYFGIKKGEKAEGESVNILIADNIYLKARNRIKILNENGSVIIENDGTINVEGKEINAKAGQSNLSMKNNGQIEIGSQNGPAANLINQDDLCVGTDPVTGSPIVSDFKKPGSLVSNQNVKVKK